MAASNLRHNLSTQLHFSCPFLTTTTKEVCLYCPLWSRRSTYVPYKLDATIIFYPLLLSCHFRKEDLYCRIAVTKGWDFILLALPFSLFSPLWCEGLLFCHWCGELLSYEILYQKMRFSLHLFSTAARLLLV